MRQSIKIIIPFLFSLQVYATIDVPTIVFSKAEIVNETTNRIPFKIIDQLIIVEAELLGKTGNFIIDTGAESLVLNSNHFKVNTLFSNTDKEVNGVHGAIETINVKHISALKLHDMRLKKLCADIIDLSHFETIKKINLLGIIGYSVLKDFELFIDTHLNQITLTKTDNYGNRLTKHVYAETIHDSVDFALKKHTIIVKGHIGNHKVRLGLDTAAEYNQLNKKLKPKILDYFYAGKSLQLTGASGKTTTVLAGKLHRFKINDAVYFGPMKTVITNLSKMNGAFGTHLDGILGFEFFKQKRTIINYKKQKLYFIKHPLPRY